MDLIKERWREMARKTAAIFATTFATMYSRIGRDAAIPEGRIRAQENPSGTAPRASQKRSPELIESFPSHTKKPVRGGAGKGGIHWARRDSTRAQGKATPAPCPSVFAGAKPVAVRVPSVAHKKACLSETGLFGTPEGTRTPNPQNRNLMRYPLRYWRIFTCQVIIARARTKVKRKFAEFQKTFLG